MLKLDTLILAQVTSWMILVAGVLGLVGNFLSIIILNTRDMRTKCFNNLLTTLNITDRFYCLAKPSTGSNSVISFRE